MNNENKKMFKIIFPALILIMCLVATAHSYLMIPSQQRIIVGEQLEYQVHLPEKLLANISIHLTSAPNAPVQLDGQQVSDSSFELAGLPILTEPGTLEFQFRIFDLIPFKKVSVDVVPEYLVYPGGQSVGVLLQSRGVQVVGYSPIFVASSMLFPAKEAGIEEGDFILQINGHNVSSDWEIAEMINKYGQTSRPLKLLLKQGNGEKEIDLKPIYCKDTGRYRVGLYVRDTTAGVGTISFYDGNNGVYGALGHVITDSETNQILEISRGKIVSAAIKGIEMGRRGQPGEKIGIFLDQSSIVGTIEKNTDFGIYGKLSKPISHELYSEPIPVALGNQIENGPAQILTVLSEEEIESFDIEIERVFSQRSPSTKGMIIRITDQRLLNITGGIVQGMSGSPIIQNGRLVGAVTHVFVNDPTRGYGILAEWMLEEANEIRTKGLIGQLPSCPILS